MGQAIPTQQPAVVPRDRFNHLRAFLVVTLVAVAGLISAVVVLASDGGEVAGEGAAKPAVQSSVTARGSDEGNHGPVSLRAALGRRAGPAD